MTSLRKEIGFTGLTMVAIGSCIGSGIFLTPSQVAAHLPVPWMILLVWALGGVIALTGALTFAELGGLFPQAGGVYVYLKEGYGDFFGFLYGWSYLLIVCSGAIAALSIAFASYLSFLFPMSASMRLLVAVTAVAVVTVVNVFRVKVAETFATVFTGLKLLGSRVVIGIGLGLGSVKTLSVSAQTGAPDGNYLNLFGLALIGVLWSYGGWQHASFVAGEVKDARRTVPRAMIAGAAIVALVYLLTNIAYMLLLPVASISASSSVAADAIRTVIPSGGSLVAVMIAISVFGTAGIYTLSSPRIYFAMARDGLFFERLTRLHPTYGTPVVAILVQSTWAVVLLLFWGTFEDVITYVVFTDWIFFGMAAAAIFIFRRKYGEKSRPYKTHGYPIVPLLFISITGYFVLNTFIRRPLHAGAGLLFLGLGWPVYYFFKKRSRKTGRIQP